MKYNYYRADSTNKRVTLKVEEGIAPIIAIGIAVLYLAGTVCGIVNGQRQTGQP